MSPSKLALVTVIVSPLSGRAPSALRLCGVPTSKPFSPHKGRNSIPAATSHGIIQQSPNQIFRNEEGPFDNTELEYLLCLDVRHRQYYSLLLDDAAVAGG
jgi:hypothetical protein